MGNLDTGFASGLDASGRKVSFFSLPSSQVFEEGLKVGEALEKSGMDFRVAKRPVYSKKDTGRFVEVAGKFETYRTDDETTLGIVGNQYKEFDNYEAFALVDELLGHGVEIRSAGTWNGGADVFISAKLPKGIEVPGVVNADLYLMFRNNHAGTGSVSCHVTPVDLRCTNMIGSAIRGAVSTWKCRHTRSVGSRVEEAKHSLQLADTYRQSLAETAKALADMDMELEEFNGFLKQLTNAERVQERIRNTYLNSPNLTPGSRWGAFSAVTETLDWSPARQTSIETRFASQLDGAISNTRTRAMNLLLTR